MPKYPQVATAPSCEVQKASAAGRRMSSHCGSESQPCIVPHPTGKMFAPLALQLSTSSDPGGNRIASGDTGCSGLVRGQLRPEISPWDGSLVRRPSRSDMRTSSGRVTYAPSPVSSTKPQSSSAKVCVTREWHWVRLGPTIGCNGPKMWVQPASSVFMLTASLAVHEANTKSPCPGASEPVVVWLLKIPSSMVELHGHWYAWTSKRRPRKLPLTNVNTPTP